MSGPRDEAMRVARSVTMEAPIDVRRDLESIGEVRAFARLQQKRAERLARALIVADEERIIDEAIRQRALDAMRDGDSLRAELAAAIAQRDAQIFAKHSAEEELAAARDVLERYPATVILWEQATADRERLTAELAAAQAERDEARLAARCNAEAVAPPAFVGSVDQLEQHLALLDERDAALAQVKRVGDALVLACEQRDAARREVEGMRGVVAAAIRYVGPEGEDASELDTVVEHYLATPGRAR